MKLQELYQTLQQRKRPEDVAQMILDLSADLCSGPEIRRLERVAKGSLAKRWFGYTSMLQEFARPVGAENQVETAISFFGLEDFRYMDYSQADNIERFLAEAAPLIKKEIGQNSFQRDRLNKTERKAAGLDVSKRIYNKQWRLLRRIELRLQKLAGELQKWEYSMVAKHGLAHHISSADFVRDPETAFFIAYFTSRCNLRSEFTIQGQQRAFDELSEVLLKRCFRQAELPDSKVNWWAIAHVYPAPKVLAQLSDEQKGQLLGRWTDILNGLGEMLEELWETNEINQKTMIVRRGNDSSTWNSAAGAWNKSRDNWMNLLYALGMDYVLDQICFGKVMRLMAADVAHWHRATGGKLDPNTEVWNQLALPWKVLRGEATCTRKEVKKACRQAGIWAEESGWIAPRKVSVATFRPTPELVHGVSIENPFLAKVLRQHKVFSGKPAKNWSF